MNGESHKGYAKASVLDKTDWRKTIHQCLEHCVNTIGTTEFPRVVKSLKNAVSARFPGFDAERLIGKFELLINNYYDLKKRIWLMDHQTMHSYEKKIRIAEFNIERDEEIFTFIKNLLAEKRILLYGIKETSGGEQMGIPGISDDE